jgi:hypothetical protein
MMAILALHSLLKRMIIGFECLVERGAIFV